jgi:hypothetical protein
MIYIILFNFILLHDNCNNCRRAIDNQSTLKALLFESFKSRDLKSFEKHL